MDTSDAPETIISTPVFIPPARRGRPSEYKDIFCEWVVEAGAMGCSIKGMWAYIVQEKQANVPLKTFQEWYRRGAPQYKPEFHAAIQEGQALAQRRFEQIGLDASAGNLKGHASGTYQFLVKNRFRSDYKDEVHQTIDKKSTIRIDANTPPQLAAQQYKELILDSGRDESFEEFFGEDV